MRICPAPLFVVVIGITDYFGFIFFDTEKWSWMVTLWTETSHVTEEKKSNEIPLVVASEKGIAQIPPILSLTEYNDYQ